MTDPERVLSSEVECSHMTPCTPDYRCSMHRKGRVPSPSNCVGCGHIAKHHNKRRSVYAGLMADYRVIFACGWTGCGCPEFVKAKP